MSDERDLEEQIKSQLILKRLNNKEELRDWMYTYLDIKFPMDTVYPNSTHAPVDAMWRIYELIQTGKSQEVPQVCMLSSRDSFKTLSASAIMVLLMVHFRLQLATAGAIKAQSDKMIQYIAGHFRKIEKYLEENKWRKISESKSRTDWLDENGWLCFVRIVVATVAGMNCVKGNTIIKTNKGNLPASEIYKRIGENEDIYFLSYNHDSGSLEYKSVVARQKNNHKKIFRIKTSNGTIECSGDHKIYVKGKGYVKAKNITKGETLYRKKRKTTESMGFEELGVFFKKYGFILKSNPSKYVNTNSKIEIQCIQGHIKETTLNRFNRKKDKTFCKKCNEVSFNKAKEIIEKEGYTLKTKECDYKNSKSLLTTVCPNGHFYNVKYGSFVHKKNRCNKGSCNKKKLKKDFVVDYIKKQGYLVNLDEYENQKEKIEVTCPNGHVSKISFTNFYNHKKRCRHCYKPYSRGHQEIVDYIRSIYKGDVSINDSEVIKPFELDIYIPEFNFGIEFDGLYWHSEAVKINACRINKEKSLKIQDNNIKVLMIYEDEWADSTKKELIKNMIRYRLGFFNKKKRASSLELRRLERNDDFKDFFDKFHLDGHTQASFAYALFDNEKMVSCMSFRKSFSDKCWEIARFATNYDYRIYGNAGRFVKKFLEKESNEIVTYSNNRLSLGFTYKKLGFEEVTKTKQPSYYYTDFRSRVWRFKCKKINDPKITSKYPTERDQAKGGVFSEKYFGHKKPLYRIYDYGHRKWKLKV